MNLTSPLNLKKTLKGPLLKPQAFPFFDVLLIAFILSLFSTQYLFTPGLTIDLPESSTPELTGTSNISVISINQANMIFFEGSIYNLDTLEARLSQYIKTANQTHPVLLAKASKHTSIDAFFRVCEIAKRAGFVHVQLAATPSPS